MDDGNLVVSFRNISTVVDRRAPHGPGDPGSSAARRSAQQHDPRPLPNGNLLIFDNGPHRRDHPAPYSRVIEVDPRTRAIVWEYRDQSLFDLLQPVHLGRAAPGQRQHADLRGLRRTHLRGDRRRQVGVGVRQPALRLEPAGPGSTTGSSARSATRRTRSIARAAHDGAPRRPP
jgi:hypothetical protein